MKASELIAILSRDPEREIVAWDPRTNDAVSDDIYRVVKAEPDKFHIDGPWVWVLDLDTTDKGVEQLDKWLDGIGELDCE